MASRGEKLFGFLTYLKDQREQDGTGLDAQGATFEEVRNWLNSQLSLGDSSRTLDEIKAELAEAAEGRHPHLNPFLASGSMLRIAVQDAMENNQSRSDKSDSRRVSTSSHRGNENIKNLLLIGGLSTLCIGVLGATFLVSGAGTNSSQTQPTSIGQDIILPSSTPLQQLQQSDISPTGTSAPEVRDNNCLKTSDWATGDLRTMVQALELLNDRDLDGQDITITEPDTIERIHINKVDDLPHSDVKINSKMCLDLPNTPTPVSLLNNRASIFSHSKKAFFQNRNSKSSLVYRRA